MKRACHIPSDSELASLFTLINRIKRDEIVTNANNGIVYRTMMERLKTYWVYYNIQHIVFLIKSIIDIFSRGNT